jgi:excisionase family DNA binding protein
MEKNQEDFFARMEANLSSPPAGKEIWIDGLEVQNLLGITRKTVYRLIIDGTLKPRRLGRRNYFAKSSIFDLRNRFLK